MDLALLLPAVAVIGGAAWPAIRRHRIIEAGERTLRNSRARVLPL